MNALSLCRRTNAPNSTTIQSTQANACLLHHSLHHVTTPMRDQIEFLDYTRKAALGHVYAESQLLQGGEEHQVRAMLPTSTNSFLSSLHLFSPLLYFPSQQKNRCSVAHGSSTLLLFVLNCSKYIQT